MTTTLNINNLFMLNNFFNDANKEKIEKAFMKSSFRSSLDNYKEGSTSWLTIKAEEDAITSMETVKLVYEYKELEIFYSYHKVKFHIMSYTETMRDYDYNNEGGTIDKEITYNFLCTNSYWGYGVITSMYDLLGNLDVKNLLFISQKEKCKEDILSNLVKFDEKFIVIGDYLLKILNWQNSEIVLAYRKDIPIVIVGKQEFSLPEIEKIYDARKNDMVFYDENDRKIYKYDHESYYEYYNKCNS
jgi:hypothetical protein